MKRPWLEGNNNQFDVRKLAHVGRLKARIGWQNLRTDEFIEKGPYCVTGTDFSNGEINWNTSYHVSLNRYEIDQNIQLKENDLLITKDGTIGKVAVVRNMPGLATLNSGVFLLRSIGEGVHSSYLKWVVQSKVFDDFVMYNSTGSTINHLYQNVFEQFRFPYPDHAIQKIIADFLDRETARIDRLIDKKQRLVELAEEKRSALITAAVTGEIDPATGKRRGRDCRNAGGGSSVKRPWLEGNNNQFDVRKLAHVGRLKARIGWQNLRTDEFIEKGPYCVTGTDFSNGEINWNTSYHVSLNRYEIDQNIQLKENDLLITKDGTIGKVAVVRNMPGLATLNSGVFLLRSIGEGVHSSYLKWVVQSKVFDDFVMYNSTGSTINHLYQNVFEQFRFPYPDHAIQKIIADFLDRETARIDALTAKVVSSIDRLREYRSALITAAVTGQIDVTNAGMPGQAERRLDEIEKAQPSPGRRSERTE